MPQNLNFACLQAFPHGVNGFGKPQPARWIVVGRINELIRFVEPRLVSVVPIGSATVVTACLSRAPAPQMIKGRAAARPEALVFQLIEQALTSPLRNEAAKFAPPVELNHSLGGKARRGRP
jgi:hypothetical protein